MAEQIFSRDRLLIRNFPLNLLTVSLMCVAAASQGQAINSDQTQSMSSYPTGRGLDARLWRSEFGFRDLHNEGQKNPAFEEKLSILEKSANAKEASDISKASPEKKTASEPSLRHESMTPKERQSQPTLQSEDPRQTAKDAESAKNSRQPKIQKAVEEEAAFSEATDEKKPSEKESRTIERKQDQMESHVERAGFRSAQPREPSDMVAFEKLSSTETTKIKPPQVKTEGDAMMVPELSLEAVTTAVTMNDVNSSESVQNDEAYVTDGSAVQVSMVTVSDWDRAAADSMRSGLSTGVKGPSLTTYLVGIAALIVVGGAVLSPR